ncbi:hypothetical protein FQN49_003706, partial [Arthroderma sp. PD_2]
MAEQLDERSFCWECYWPNLDTDGNTTLPPDCADLGCWNQGVFQNQSTVELCGTGTECCDDDQCSAGCPTVCDGFVDCDKSTACSEPPCNDIHCDNQSTACFDMKCVSESEQQVECNEQNHFFGQGLPLNWGCLDLPNDTAVNEASLHDCNIEHDKFRPHLHFHS